MQSSETYLMNNNPNPKELFDPPPPFFFELFPNAMNIDIPTLTSATTAYL